MSIQGIATGLALLAALGLAGYQAHRADKAELALATKTSEFAEYRRAAADQALKVANANGLETARRLKVQSEALHAETLKSQAVQAAAARAAAAHGSLRGETARLAARGRAAASDPSLGPECQATGTASAVLADLLGRCSSERRELAQYADRARIAGEACVSSYDALTP